MPSIEGHLTDPTRCLSTADRQRFEHQLDLLQHGTNVDVAVVILDASDRETVKRLAEACYRAWNIGKSWKGGILIAIGRDSDSFAVICSDSALLGEGGREKLEEELTTSMRTGSLTLVLKQVLDRVRVLLGVKGDSQEDLPMGDVSVPGIEGHITDPARRLSDRDRIEIDKQLGSFQDDTQVDFAMFLLARPAEHLREMGRSCYSRWSIGRGWAGGILLIVSHDLSDCALIVDPRLLSDKDARELETMVRARLRKGEVVESLLGALGRTRNLLANKVKGPGKGNPPVPGIESHFTDAQRRLTEKERLTIDEALSEIQRDSKVDAVIFILASPVESLKEMARSCFARWSIGKSWQGGGILVLISSDLKDCSVITSESGGPLKSEVVDQLEQMVKSRLRQGESNQSLMATLRFTAERIRRQVQATGSKPVVHPPFEPDRVGARKYGLWAVAIALLAAFSTWGRSRMK